MSQKIEINSKDIGSRLDKFLTQKLNLSRSQIQKLIKSGAILINDKKTDPHHFLKENEIISVSPPNAKYQITNTKLQIPNYKLPKFKLKIVTKTADYLIINKPAGIPVHPDENYKSGTLIQKITRRFPRIKKVGEDKIRPGIVHRLDKEVSGLLVVARNQKMFEHLKEQFSKQAVKKQYIALVYSRVSPESGEINFPIARSKNGIMAARSTAQAGKSALTKYEVIKYYINYSLIKVWPKTGRTHQIRVHFKALGHPLVGDIIYKIKKQKSEKYPLERIFLHAQNLGFYDLNNQWQEFQAELPPELKDYLEKIK